MSTKAADTTTVSDERLLELLEIYHNYSYRLFTAKSRFNTTLREVERRGLEIPEWVYESPHLM